MTRSKAFHRAEGVLARLHARVRPSVPELGLIEAVFPVSGRTWGETLTIRITGDDGDVILEVTGRSRTMLFGFMDFGKSADNVRRFVTAPEFDSSVIEAKY